jgi:hypothetical protein
MLLALRWRPAFRPQSSPLSPGPVDNAADWMNFGERDWTGYISSRRSDS